MRFKNRTDYDFYICGRCNGEIPYLRTKGKPSVCPECGYSTDAFHGGGTRDVNDVPDPVRINLNEL